MKTLIVILLIVGLAIANAGGVEETPPPPPVPEVYYVQPGDSLWSVARMYYPHKDPREVIYHIRTVNPDVNPGSLQVGQKLLMPTV